MKLPRPHADLQVVTAGASGDQPGVVVRRTDAAGAGWASDLVTAENAGLLVDALSRLPQAISVSDRNMRIVLSNHAWGEKFGLGPLAEPGAYVQPMIEALAARGEYGPGTPGKHADFRKRAIQTGLKFELERPQLAGGRLLVAGSPLAGGGYITVLTDLRDEAAGAAAGEVARMQEEIEDLHRANRHLGRLAATDPLLGIPNRRSFLRTAEKERAPGGGSLRLAVVMMVDADRFKSLNDMYGHQSGDVALLAIVGALRSALRTCDHLCRYGGEEFAALLMDIGPDEALRLAERARAAVAEAVVALPDRTLRVTVSIGLAEWLPGERNIESALARADVALYAAKISGRDQVRLNRS